MQIHRKDDLAEEKGGKRRALLAKKGETATWTWYRQCPINVRYGRMLNIRAISQLVCGVIVALALRQQMHRAPQRHVDLGVRALAVGARHSQHRRSSAA
eukprot:1044128-Pleurochrysis_carterae.AAC.5